MTLEFLVARFGEPIRGYEFLKSELIDYYKLKKAGEKEVQQILQEKAPECATHYRFATSFDEINRFDVFGNGDDYCSVEYFQAKEKSKQN